MALYASSRRGHYPLWQSLDVPATHAPQFLPGSRILFGTITGDDALEISALSGATEEDVRADVKEVLQDMFPNATLPAFDLTYHDWAADPLFHGSYSNFPPSWDPDLHQNLRSSVGHGRLRWAGEAGSATWFGFLHGAYADGKAAALELIECIHLGDKCKDDFVPRPQGPGGAPVWPGH
ncbi:flavin-containing amine oxidoreductase-domain containing protein [Schizophyllum commune]